MTAGRMLAGALLISASTQQVTADASDDFSFRGPDTRFVASCNTAAEVTDRLDAYHFSQCAEIERTRGGNPAKYTVGQRAPDLARYAGGIMVEVEQWFDGMGYRGISTYNNTLKFILRPGDDVLGAFEPTNQGLTTLWLYMKPAFESGPLEKNHLLTSTIAHELFHGVQHAHRAYYQQHNTQHDEGSSEEHKTTGDPEDWFSEATAEYVGDYFQHLKHGTDLEIYKSRDYEKPLTDVTEKSTYLGYGTSTFYAALARRMSGDVVSEGLESLSLEAMQPAYLSRVLTHMDENASSDLLDDFDKALAATGPFAEGLYRLYPEVMRDFAYGPDYNLRRDGFPFVENDALRRDRRIKVEEREGWVWEKELTVAELATEFFFINSDEVSQNARLLIEVEPVEGSEDRASDLHLLVDGRQFSFVTAGSRNVALLQQTDHMAIIGVANVARNATDSKPVQFRLKVTWLVGGTCDYDAIFASTDLGEQKRAMVENGVPLDDVEDFFDAMFPTPTTYLEEYGKSDRRGAQVQPDIHPDIATLYISTQNMTAGGQACAHHLASSTLLEAELLGNPAGLPGGAAQSQDVADDLETMFSTLGRNRNNQDPTFRAPRRQDTQSVFRKMAGAFGLDAREGSVMVTVFSPDLYGFWQGHAAYANEGPLIASQGWGPKESAAVTLMLSGTRVSDLKAGRVYPAISVDAAMGGPAPLLSRWSGSWTNSLGPEGTFDMIMPRRLAGFVRVEQIEQGRVFASFTLRGEGYHQRSVTYLDDNGGEQVMVEKDVSPGATPIFIEGAFQAPVTITGTPIYRNIFLQRSVSRFREGQ